MFQPNYDSLELFERDVFSSCVRRKLTSNWIYTEKRMHENSFAGYELYITRINFHKYISFLPRHIQCIVQFIISDYAISYARLISTITRG